MTFSRVFALMTVGASMALAADRLAADPPARVGRLNYLSGSVSMRPAGSDEWAAAVPNRPLTTGDRIWTDRDSRAELHVGSTAIRMDAQSELDLTVVDDNILQLRLATGSMNLVVRHLDEGQDYEIDTPNGAVSIGRAGEYRVDVNADGTTSVVTVWTGSVQVTSAGSSFAVDPRQQASINGTDSPTYNLVDAPAFDAWDQWCAGRDQLVANSQSARYVSTEMTGYEDLDAYGRWQTVPGYGPVWYPSAQPAGWAPYHTGHWVWMDPWGWTWIDEAPWGYAPYHYGRWAYLGGGWGWIPGQMAPRPVYAPAMVAFVGSPGRRPGFSAGIAVGVGGAAVAWFALGPQEVYRPAYAVSPGYVRQVNVTNVTNITNVTNVTNETNVQYRNREVPGAMMATNTTAFASARPVQSASVPVTNELRSAPVTGMAPAVVPTRASLAAAPAGLGHGPVSAPPAALQSRPVMARMTPPAPPIPFAAKQQALAVNGGRPLNPSQDADIRASRPNLAAANPALVKPANTVPAGGGLKSGTTLAARPVVAHPAVGSPAAAQATHATAVRSTAPVNNTSVAGQQTVSQTKQSSANGEQGNKGNKQQGKQQQKNKNAKPPASPNHEHSEKPAKSA